MKIEFPKDICSNFDGYSFFIELHERTKNLILNNIELDFTKTEWFEANFCAVLGAIINEIQSNLNSVELTNLKPLIKDIFSRNHFMASFGGYIIPDATETTIKYRKNKLTDEKFIKEFLFSELILKSDFPKLSLIAQKEIARSIFEIYSNAVIHGDCDFVYSCGQYFPRKSPPHIDFTIVDMGRSIKTNVNEYLNVNKTGKEAIEWAIEANNSTKPKINNIPGGLGLKLILDFVKLNKGKIQIVSSDGYWEMNKGKINSDSFNYFFSGTIVNIEFNLDDKNFYYLKSEKVEDIIF
ncbi:MAG: hypothetical protein PHT69_15145 [Bacteroidales bacterium]|nr:hypothetical protein [Bacteroidales bacterium]